MVLFPLILLCGVSNLEIEWNKRSTKVDSILTKYNHTFSMAMNLWVNFVVKIEVGSSMLSFQKMEYYDDDSCHHSHSSQKILISINTRYYLRMGDIEEFLHRQQGGEMESYHFVGEERQSSCLLLPLFVVR